MMRFNYSFYAMLYRYNINIFFKCICVHVEMHVYLRHYLVNEKFKDFLLTALDSGQAVVAIYNGVDAA